MLNSFIFSKSSMIDILLRAPSTQDEEQFLFTMNKSQAFHFPFVDAPKTPEAFQQYLLKSQQQEQKYFIAWTKDNGLIGVFNINHIVRGFFKSAYLGYYACVDYAGKGFMSQALKLVLKEIFTNLDLHRIEANIQPANTASIHLVTSNGFLQEGFSPRYLKINDIWQDHCRFALTIEDWLAKQ